MSLSHLLNGLTPGSSNGLLGPAPPTASASPKRKKRPAKAPAAFLPDDDPARRSSRQSTRPKRYADELYEDQEALNAQGFAGGQTAYNAAFSRNGDEGPLDGQPPESDSEDADVSILRATAHIWREPLEDYVRAQHAKKQGMVADLEKDERSRAFVTAARVTEMSERRVAEMRERREVRLVEMQFEEESRSRVEEEERARLAREEEKRAGKEKEKEERLRKQREAAKRKRDEDRAKKDRDDEARKARAEKDRLVKIAEAERKLALSPEEREAEERALQARKQKEAEEAMLRVKELEDDLLGAAEGRGARKKRRMAGDAEEEAAKALNGLGGPSHGHGSPYSLHPNDDYDELDEDPYGHSEGGRSRSKGKASSRRSSAGPGGYDYYGGAQGYYPPPPGVDQHGNPLAHYPYPYPPPPLPHGAYVGPDHVLYDAQGQPLSYPPPPYPMMPGYPHPGGSPSGHPHPYAASSSGAPYGEYDQGDEEDENLPMTGKGSRNPKVLATKRWKAIEDLERRVWTQIAKRDIPKVVRVTQQSTSSRVFFAKRLSTIVSREARRAAQRTKGVKDVQTRGKKVMREMMVFMKGNEKKERESRKKAEKEALEKAKKEEEVREASRTARKLNFLLTQTELYSHFIGNKIKTEEAEESDDTATDARLAAPPQHSASLAAAIAAGDAPEGTELKELDFDVDDEANVAQHARRNAQAAIDAAKNAAAAFDAAASAGGVVSSSKAADGLDFADEMDYQNPTGMKGDVQVTQPKLLTCTLKEYQLKGLNWLANLYEQGINGILADEMGLGKTVQSISLMAYLAEVHNIWGPFLVIAPASTLHNWQQEITRFVPGLKALPYWGNTKDRAVLRKFWNRKSLRYDKDAPFHILVTSYQLVVQDEKYFQGVKWQYMVLDEAQAIKSSTSARWKTLLGFRCRNRLLLTGTPIQNSMHELWALLHFIMPSLFDSHDEFSEWFSKDIENNAENKGAMNEHQLRRLHVILKPFMLRRIKKNVQNELGDKIEIDLYCDLTPRQKTMYRTLRENISITDLVSRASSLNDDDSVKRLMNLIMQFRKVCNHPELFERADVTAPLAFASFSETANLVRDPDILEVPYATKSVIEYRVPKLLYRDGGMLSVVGENSRAGSDTLYLDRLLNIWTPEHIHRSLSAANSAFDFTRGMDLSPAETSKAVKSHGILRIGLGLDRINSALDRHDAEALDVVDSNSLSFAVPTKSATLPFDQNWRALGLTPLSEVEQTYRLSSRLSKVDARFYMDTVVAPSINAVCSDRSFVYDQQKERFDPLFSAALFGLPTQGNREEIERFETALPGFPAKGVLAASSPAQLPFPPMQVPQLQKLILDSGKLAKLDTLLTELKANGHRVLVYFQMTKMIDLMEEYLAFRQYKYLRLDGSSTISERRDMVMDWQTKPELFIFLLSTRAGGLGINLTAADTVIFYDSDWNPSNDLQAMDRAHRLGQTKQVTVYRLITKDTVDERIVQLARNKKLVQDAVVGSSSMSHTDTSAAAKTNEVVSLLLGEDELEEGLRQAERRRKRAEEKQIEDGKRGAARREDNKNRKALEKIEAAEAKKKAATAASWADDDDDGFAFFSSANANNALGDDDDGQPSGAGGETTPVGPKKKAAPKKRKAAGDDGDEPKPKKPRAPPKKKVVAAAPPAAT